MAGKQIERHNIEQDAVIFPIKLPDTSTRLLYIVLGAAFGISIPLFFILAGYEKSTAKEFYVLVAIALTLFSTVSSLIFVRWRIKTKQNSSFESQSSNLANANPAIIISKSQLSVPGALAIGKATKRIVNSNTSLLIFDISKISDLESQSGSRNAPKQFIIKIKNFEGQELKYRFINPLKSEEEKELYAALHKRSGLSEDNSPFSDSAQEYRKTKYQYLITFLLTAIFGSTLFFVLLLSSQPIHYYSSLLTIILYATAGALPLGYFLKNNLIKIPFKEGLGTKTPVLVFFTAIVAILANGILLAETYSTTELREFSELIIDKKRLRRKKNVLHHLIVFNLSKNHHPYAMAFDENTEVRISSTLYSKIVPSQSRISGRIHFGIFGLPMLKNFELTNLKEGSVLSNPKEGQNFENLKNWKANLPLFPKPDRIEEEKYPDGKYRSQIPVYQNQYHGIASYYHPNGQLYGEIIWVNGKKEGRHQLYRTDGTLEGDYSYHKGEPHGENRWYNVDGSVKQVSIFKHGKLVQ